MMQAVWMVLGLSCLAASVLAGQPTTTTAPASAPSGSIDPAVIVDVRQYKAAGLGNAFFIGDGSLAVTARHNVYGNNSPDSSETLGLISLISPYLGDVSEARIVAEDRDLDLLVLRCGWKNHPAFALADEKAVLQSAHVAVRGFGGIVYALMNNDHAAVQAPIAGDEEILPIDMVGVRLGRPRSLTTLGSGRISLGWSGSAMLLPGSDEVVGGISTVHGRQRFVGVKKVSSAGFLTPPLVQLLQEKGLADALKQSDPSAVARRPPDAPEATRAFLGMVSALSHSAAPAAALQQAETALRLRPDNVFALVRAASMSEKLERPVDAERFYRQALERDPRSVGARVMFAQFLHEQKRDDEAMKLLIEVRDGEPNSTVWASGMCNILGAQGKNAECMNVLKEASKRNPRDAVIWGYLGQAQRDMKDYAAAIKSLERAMELDESIAPVRFMFAQTLESAGELDRAETQLRALVRLDPDTSLSHFALANFLKKHRPQRHPEAAIELERALELPDGPGRPPREMMRKMLDSLRQAPATTQASPPGSSGGSKSFRL